MNISLRLHRLIFYMVFLSIPSALLSQVEYHDVLVNDSLYYNFESVGNAPQVDIPPSNGHYVFNGLVNYPLGIAGNNELIYVPDQDYTGPDTIKILYYVDGNTGPTQSYLTLILDVIDAYVVAVNDFASTSPSTAVTIDVLSNDLSMGDLTLTNIPLGNHGEAIIVGDEIEFTPSIDFVGIANLTYTVCDLEADLCDVGTVSVFVLDDVASNDTTTLVTMKNDPIRALFPIDNGIQEIEEPGNGSLELTNGGVEYTPDNDFVGKDTFTYAYNINDNTSVETFIIDVLWAPDPSEFVVNDFAFCSIDDNAELNVLENDLNDDLAILYFTQSDAGGIVLHLGNGDFQYSPPSNYSGIDFFEYTATIPGTSSQETGTVYITVDNQPPSSDEYELYTPKNTPLIINYDIPITNFDFVIINQSYNGVVEYYPGDFSDYDIQVNGQDVEGYNLLIYYPNLDFVGSDDFEIEYCIGGLCESVSIYAEIQEIDTPQADTLCVGDCVWSGDANGNGKVDMLDLLPLGYCVGEVGYERSNPTTEWYGQFADNWNCDVGESGVNVKHVDTNGDGYISVEDTISLSQSYGLYNDLIPEDNPVISQVPLFFVPENSNPGPGDLVVINIVLGLESLPATNIHGITFALNFNEDIVEPGTMKVGYSSDNWLAYGTAMVDMMKEPYLGRVESGYTRTTGTSAHGYGRIGQVSFIVVDDIIDGGRLRDTLTRTFRPQGLVSMDQGGHYMEMISQDFDLRIAHHVDDPFFNDDRMLIAYPNPTSDNINVHINGGHELEQVLVHSLTGQEVMVLDGLSGNNTQIAFNEKIANGMYLITAVCERGVFTKKVQLFR